MPVFTRPGKALIGLMVVITTFWLMFAIGLNWGGASASVFLMFAGNTDAILHGQIWRLFTAPLLHSPSSILDLILPLLGLTLLAPRLEEAWGSPRMLRFMALTSVLAYVLQAVVGLLLPAALSARLVGTYWFGLGPSLTAISIAWACTFKDQVVNLIIMPVSSRTLIWIIVGLACLGVATGDASGQGLLSPFFGMLLGWALGGGTPSPLRKAWLRLRLARLDAESGRSAGLGAPRKARPNPGGLRVIPGGRSDDEDDKGPDGRWLN